MKIEFSYYAANHIDIERRTELKPFSHIFFEYYANKYIERYGGKSKYIYYDYISSGVERLDSFAEFLREQGFETAKSYYLKPNSIILKNRPSSMFGKYNGIFSLSFGIEISDDDPKLVEFKLIIM